jgi:hypothetical protein
VLHPYTDRTTGPGSLAYDGRILGAVATGVTAASDSAGRSVAETESHKGSRNTPRRVADPLREWLVPAT